MERLDTLVARVLADTRQRMDGRKAGAAVEAAPELARDEGEEAPALAVRKRGHRRMAHMLTQTPMTAIASRRRP